MIQLEWFDDCIDRRSKVDGDRVFAVDLAPDRATAAIVVVGGSSRGGTHVETVEHRPGAGSDWIAGRLAELVERWPTRFVAEHLGGPIGPLESQLRSVAGGRFRALTDRELTAACGQFHDAVRDGDLVHIGDPPLREALEGAARSTSSDAWRRSRRNSAVDISPLMAATVGWSAYGLPVEVVDEPVPAKLGAFWA